MASNPSVRSPSPRSVVVVGAGIVGLASAWLLCRRGHRVLLLDAAAPLQPGSSPGDRAGCGSESALGVLLARVFQRSSGRAWRLRQRSLELWRDWRLELSERGRPVPWRPGVLLLAADAEDLRRQQALLADPRRSPAGFERWDPTRLAALQPGLPAAALGALHSPEDGQLDPIAALRALAEDACEGGLERHCGSLERLEPYGRGWRLRLRGGEQLETEWVVLAAGLASAELLPADLQPAPPQLQPVLGQALELELDARDVAEPSNWPGVVVWRGVNLILRRPEADGAAGAGAGWRLWLGATLEPGRQASATALEELRDLGGEGPDWLLRAAVIRRWQGLRARPEGMPAPLLQQPAPGLLLASGHYRNGVLLAPASAEWVVACIEAGTGAA